MKAGLRGMSKWANVIAMNRTKSFADRFATTLSGFGAVAFGLAGLALSRALLLRPART